MIVLDKGRYAVVDFNGSGLDIERTGEYVNPDSVISFGGESAAVDVKSAEELRQLDTIRTNFYHEALTSADEHCADFVLVPKRVGAVLKTKKGCVAAIEERIDYFLKR